MRTSSYRVTQYKLKSVLLLDVFRACRSATCNANCDVNLQNKIHTALEYGDRRFLHDSGDTGRCLNQRKGHFGRMYRWKNDSSSVLCSSLFKVNLNLLWVCASIAGGQTSHCRGCPVNSHTAAISLSLRTLFSRLDNGRIERRHNSSVMGSPLTPTTAPRGH